MNVKGFKLARSFSPPLILKRCISKKVANIQYDDNSRLHVLLGVVGVVRWCPVSFQCRGALLIWSRVGQGPTVLAVGANGGCLDIFSLLYHFSFLSPSLWETVRYRLKYCLKGPSSRKQPTNQPTNQPTIMYCSVIDISFNGR